jgi:hypothetical protein
MAEHVKRMSKYISGLASHDVKPVGVASRTMALDDDIIEAVENEVDRLVSKVSFV